MNRPNCPRCEPAEVIATAVRDQEYGAPGEYRWLRCRECDLVRIEPEPSSETLAIAYPEDYHGYIAPTSGLTRRLRTMSTAGLAKKMASLVPDGGRVLDLGCAHGNLLVEIGKLGTFELYGVEYHPKIASIAGSRGIRAFAGELEDADIPEASMDLVIMQHVLEHVPDPLRTLRKVAALLRPGGRVIGELPNLSSWDAALFGRNWGGGHAPRHIFHFTPSTLRDALESTGFDGLAFRSALHTGHWALSLQNWLRRNRRDTGGLVSGRTWYYPALLLATIPINLIQMLFLKTGIMRFEGRKT